VPLVILLYGISKFPLTYVSSPQGERMEVRGLIYCMEFQSSPSPYILPGLPHISAGMLKRCSLFVAPASPRGERGTHEVGRGEGANL